VTIALSSAAKSELVDKEVIATAVINFLICLPF
jgi:hypothetical protein